MYKPSSDSFACASDIHMDEASPSYAMWWYLFFHCRLRMVLVRDVFHRQWNDAKLTLIRKGLWWVVLLTTVMFNMPFGPYDARSFW